MRRRSKFKKTLNLALTTPEAGQISATEIQSAVEAAASVSGTVPNPIATKPNRPTLHRHHTKLVAGALATSALAFGLALHGRPALADEGDFDEVVAEEFTTEEPEITYYEVGFAEDVQEAGALDIPGLPITGGTLPVTGGMSQLLPEPIWEALPWDKDRGPNWTNRVLLTFDDCMADPDHFIGVLDHATELNIGLLLFPTGNCVTMFQNMFGIDLPQAIRDRGHWMGNHSITHPRLTRSGRAEIARQISWPESNILRPPFGDWNHVVYEVAADLGMRIMMWDLDTNDWRGKSEQEVIDLIVTYAEPGNSVLMHFQHQGFSTDALSAIQRGLRERGIELCRPASVDNRPTQVEVPENIC